MKRSLFLVVCCAASVCAQDISAQRIRAHTKFLASDLLEGRGVGARGGDLATEYIATQFAVAGLKPAGGNGSYFQRVPLVGVAPLAETKVSAVKNGRSVPFTWLDDFVGVTQTQKQIVDFDAEAIFVGHGIVAPEFKWDDFKGVDVRGKLLVLFTNEPASQDPKFFGGRALTYYGRWSYKYEQAARLGALGVIIIHTAPTAGYGWDVVRNSWGKENPQVKLEPGAHALSVAGWITADAGAKLAALAGRSVDELLNLAERRDFRPIALGVRIRGHLPNKIRNIESRNVAGIVPGSDPALASEAVIFSAHWDHLGIGTPVNGDAIYNGAVDNATGCGMLLEMARAWAALEKKPRRSALFLALTAEESGLIGSEYYARHPLVPPGKTALGLNFDGFHPLGRTTDVKTPGAERTTLWPIVKDLAGRFRLEITPDARPEQGSYYRSDHFSLAKAGIPAFSIGMGGKFAGKPDDFAVGIFNEFNAKHYHQPSDEFHEEWDFSGLEQVARFGFTIGLDTANIDRLPSWNKGDEFLAAREASFKRGR
jgi:Zn-dependent M28 family amino/carboxypeptidase